MTIKIPKAKATDKLEQRAAGFISGAQQKHPEAAIGDESKKAIVNMRFDRALLSRLDDAAQRKGISRTAYIHWVLAEHLGE